MPMASRTLRALVVDDHPLMTGAVSTALKATRLFQDIGTATSLVEATEALERNPNCDLMVLDMHLADSDGRESLVRMRERHPEVPILGFSADDSLDRITMAFECGA